MTQAFFFGTDSTGSPPLFGICTDPGRGDAPFAVLICPAFSEERQKSYRSTFLFAQRLADAGIPCMRYDYLGTGDSQGLLSDVSMESMVNDTISACAEAKRRFNVQRIVIVGIRLGAAVAAKAALRLPDIRDLVFWNPVVEGRRFFRDLTRTEAMINLARKVEHDISANTKPEEVEVDAEFLSQRFVEQLKELDLSKESHTAERYLITGQQDDKIEANQLKKLADSISGAGKIVTHWNSECMEFWSSRSMYDAFYPTRTFDATIEWLANSGVG